MNTFERIEDQLLEQTAGIAQNTEILQKLRWLPDLLQISREAGQILMRARKFHHKVEIKADNSPVTTADRNADNFIRTKLTMVAPEIPIISEEYAVPEYSERKHWRRFWLVDPLDGTKEYIVGRDDYTVNIALIEHKTPTIGIIYIPATQTFYFALQGLGSWRLDVKSNTLRRIYSVCPTSKTALIAVESRSHAHSNLDGVLKNKNVQQRIKLGSSLKFCLLAEGQAHVYPRLGPTMEWDVAAGDCIFRNSGKTDLRTSPLRYNKEDLKNESFVVGLVP